jgi:pyruvate,water dikinase
VGTALPGRWLTDWTPSERFPIYTRARAVELMGGPCSPLGWTLSWEQAMVPGWRDAYLRFGLLTERELPEHRAPVCGSFGGYLYLNLACARTGAARVPGSTVEAVDRALFGVAGLARSADWGLSTEDVPELPDLRQRADAARRSRTDLTYLTPAELVERARGLLPVLRKAFAGHIAACGWSPTGPDSADASLALWDLSRTVAHSPALKLYFDGGVPGIIERLEGSPSEDAKAFLDDFDTFLHQYGSRGPGEWDIGAEVWETNPELALSQLEMLRFAPDGEDPRRPEASAAGANAVKVVNEIRIAIRELGRQMADAHHIADQALVMMLTADELDDFVAHPEAYGLKLADRAREHAALADLEPPFFIVGTVPPLPDWAKRTNAVGG